MATTLGLIVVLMSAGWWLVKRYERYLDTQAGPWMSAELGAPRRHRRRTPAAD